MYVYINYIKIELLEKSKEFEEKYREWTGK